MPSISYPFSVPLSLGFFGQTFEYPLPSAINAVFVNYPAQEHPPQSALIAPIGERADDAI